MVNKFIVKVLVSDHSNDLLGAGEYFLVFDFKIRIFIAGVKFFGFSDIAGILPGNILVLSVFPGFQLLMKY